MSSGNDGLPGPPIDTGMDPVERRTILPRWVKAMVAVAVMLAAFSLLASALLFSTNHDAVSDNCKRIHTLVLTLDDIVASGRENIRNYEREGTLTHAQAVRALEDNARARRKLASADCPPRDRRPGL